MLRILLELLIEMKIRGEMEHCNQTQTNAVFYYCLGGVLKKLFKGE